MQVLGVEGMAGRGVVFGDIEGIEEAVEILHVRDIAADADNGFGVEGTETLYVCETGEGTVGCCEWKTKVSVSSKS